MIVPRSAAIRWVLPTTGITMRTLTTLAANALDADACEHIFLAKARPQTDPLIVHIEAIADLAKLAVVNPAALVLAIAACSGGPPPRPVNQPMLEGADWRLVALPGPAEAYITWPGCVRARRTKSRTSFTGSVGSTAITNGTRTTCDTAVKSFSES